MTTKRIHQHVKFPELSTEWYDFFVEEKIFPEVAFSADDLDGMTSEKLLKLEKDLHSRNLTPSIHAPYLDLAPGASDPKIREITALRFQQVLDLCPVIKPNIIDVHAHYERNRYGGKVDQWVENAVRTFEPLVKKAEQLKVVLAVENTFEDDPAPIQGLLEKLPSPSLKACFDNGHFHMFHKVPLKRWWEVLGSKTALLHLHDNRGERDEHLPIGDGNFSFPVYFGILREMRHEMTYTMEARNINDARKSLKALRKLLSA